MPPSRPPSSGCQQRPFKASSRDTPKPWCGWCRWVASPFPRSPHPGPSSCRGGRSPVQVGRAEAACRGGPLAVRAAGWVQGGSGVGRLCSVRFTLRTRPRHLDVGRSPTASPSPERAFLALNFSFQSNFWCMENLQKSCRMLLPLAWRLRRPGAVDTQLTAARLADHHGAAAEGHLPGPAPLLGADHGALQPRKRTRGPRL